MGEQNTEEHAFGAPEEFAAPEPAELNALLEGYKIEALIACGGMGAVYQATQISLQREVAIKVLPRELSQYEEFEKSFKAEARAMAKLTHAHLIGVYDFGEVDGMLYLVMEFIDGNSLHDAAAGQVVDPLQAVEIVQHIASGLGHAHNAGVIHRDIKLANILISQNLDPKLGDFGLAVPSDDVGSGLMMGTPGYLAPEILQDFNSTSTASDVFALGIILHQLLTGVVPDGEENADLELVPNLRGLRQLISVAIAPDLNLRFKDGDAIAKALADWLAEAKKTPAHILTAASRPNSINPLVASLAPRVARPAVVESSGNGSGKMALLGLAAVAAIGMTIFLVVRGSGGGDDATASAAQEPPETPFLPKPTPKPSPGKPNNPKTIDSPKPPTGPQFSMVGHQTESRKALSAAREILLKERRANVMALKAAVGAEESWEAYFKLIDVERQELPRFPLEGERVPLTETMLELVNQYAIEAQNEIDKAHRHAIEELHHESIVILKKSDALPEGDVGQVWENWVEWLGEDPLEVLALAPTGNWRPTQGRDRETGFAIDRAGATALVQNKLVIQKGSGTIPRSKNGELTIPRAPGEPGKHWNLRWRDGFLVGTDESKRQVVFTRDSQGFTAMEPGPDPGDSDPGEALNDPVLAELRSKFRAALKRDVGPLMASYSKLLETETTHATKRNNARAVEQLVAESEWIDRLAWETGRIFPEELKNEFKVPLDLQGKKARFDEAFSSKMSKLQGVYLDQLNKLKREYLAADKDTAEVERELNRHLNPPGTMRGRYVKLLSEKVEGTSHAVIAELNFLDADGEVIPQNRLKGHSVSSLQDGRGAHNVIDGDPKTIWHSHWKEPAAPFPHWIVIDLGEHQLLRGFRLKGRPGWNMRHTDVLKWRLYVSDDAETWMEVADGRFRKTEKVQEFVLPRDGDAPEEQGS